MKNYEKLNDMALIDLMCYFDVCPRVTNREAFARCRCNDGDCYKCRATWLNEEAKETNNDRE